MKERISILDRFVNIAKCMKELEDRIENAKDYLKRNNNLTYEAIKEVEETIEKEFL